MKINVALSMSITKGIAESKVTEHLHQVCENLAKIVFFSAPAPTVQEWTDEIADKHLSVILKVLNNVKTKKGFLSETVFTKVWAEVFQAKWFEGFFLALGRDPAYKKLKRLDEKLWVLTAHRVEASLQKNVGQVYLLLRMNEIHALDKTAKLLTTAVQDTSMSPKEI